MSCFELPNEVDMLKKYIKDLEDKIKDLKWKSYQYRWKDIYNCVNQNGIRRTSIRFEMPIIDVINFIIECDNNESGITDACDYKECHIEVYGEDP